MKRYLSIFIILVLFLLGFNIGVEANIRQDTSFHFNFSVSQQRMRYNFYGHYNNWLGGFNLEQRDNIDRIGILAGHRFRLNNNLILNLMLSLGRNFSQDRYYSEGQLQLFGEQRLGVSAAINNQGRFRLGVAYSTF